MTIRSHNPTLLTLCVTGSVTAHLLMLMSLPGWNASRETTARPLTVALLAPPPEIVLLPPEIVPPKALPMETRPQHVEPAPPVKPVLQSAVQPVVQPILTTPTLPIDASPAAMVAPEQRPVQPVVPLTETTRPPPAAATPVTPPRSDAAYLNNPRPAYPLAARRRGDQGTVLIRVLVTAEGLASNVGIEKTSGHPSLDEAALTAVRSWRFVPARQGGQTVESPYHVPWVFKLD